MKLSFALSAAVMALCSSASPLATRVVDQFDLSNVTAGCKPNAGGCTYVVYTDKLHASYYCVLHTNPLP